MPWLLFAFSGPVLWAISTHIDKYLVDRYFKETGIAVLLVFTALIGLVPLPFIAFFQPGVAALPLPSVAVILGSGCLYMTGMFFYLSALQQEEASAVAPFYQAAPLFGYALGYLLLGETLTVVQMAGGALIVCGALLLSWQREERRRRFKARLAGLMLACAFSLALSSVIFKIFAVRDEFWITSFWTYAGEALFGAGVLAMARHRREFLALLRSNAVRVLTINGANEIINLGGGLGSRYALLLAPLSLVQAIGSTTSLFVFIFGIALSAFGSGLAMEDLSGGSLLRKAVSTVLIVSGVVLINR